MLKKIISVILIFSFSLVLAGEIIQNASYDMGATDGKRDGKNDASEWWVLAGVGSVVLGLFLAEYQVLAGTGCVLGVAVAYFVPGTVPAEKIIGKPAEYAKGYTEAYIKAKRWKQVAYSGSAITGGILGLFLGGLLGGIAFGNWD